MRIGVHFDENIHQFPHLHALLSANNPYFIRAAALGSLPYRRPRRVDQAHLGQGCTQRAHNRRMGTSTAVITYGMTERVLAAQSSH